MLNLIFKLYNANLIMFTSMSPIIRVSQSLAVPTFCFIIIKIHVIVLRYYYKCQYFTYVAIVYFLILRVKSLEMVLCIVNAITALK